LRKIILLFVSLLLVLSFLIGEYGIFYWCYAEEGGDIGGHPISPLYAEHIAKVSSGQYFGFYSDHRWSALEAQKYVDNAYTNALVLMIIGSLILLAFFCGLFFMALRAYRSATNIVATF
jgi:hypothetical protein